MPPNAKKTEIRPLEQRQSEFSFQLHGDDCVVEAGQECNCPIYDYIDPALAENLQTMQWKRAMRDMREIEDLPFSMLDDSVSERYILAQSRFISTVVHDFTIDQAKELHPAQRMEVVSGFFASSVGLTAQELRRLSNGLDLGSLVDSPESIQPSQSS